MIGHTYLVGSNLDRATYLLKDLANNYAKGDNKYPLNLDRAIKLLAGYKSLISYDGRNQPRTRSNTRHDRVGFAQAVKGTNNKLHPNITCNKCGKKGHYANRCPEINNPNNTNLHQHNNDHNNDNDNEDYKQGNDNNNNNQQDEDNNNNNQTRCKEIIMFPSIQDFKIAIQMNAIKNYPVTIKDINICQKIYGKHIPALKGKSVYQTPKTNINDYIEIPKGLKLCNQHIKLCADLMYTNSIIFLLTISKHIKFGTITSIKDCTQTTLCEAFDSTFPIYNKAGFSIFQLHMDQEF